MRIVACASATVMTLACAASGQDGRTPRATFPSPPPTPRRPTFTILSLPQTVAVSRAAEARRECGVDGGGLAAAVLDTGLNVRHVDFAGEGRIPARRNFTDEDGSDPGRVTDYLGHGSNVAGILAAHGTGAGPGRHEGIAPGANIIPLKIMSQGGCEPAAVEQALDWVLNNWEAHRIRVVVASFGDNQNWGTDGGALAAPFLQPQAQAFEKYAEITKKIIKLRAAGIPVVVGSGNSWAAYNMRDLAGPGIRQGMQYPAIFRGCVSVGAVYDADYGYQLYDKPEFGRAQATRAVKDQFAPFSQRLHPDLGGACRTTIFAPMGRMYSTGRDQDGPDGSVSESIEEGTSQAAPVVAGAILLLQQCHHARFRRYACVSHLEAWLRDGAPSIRDHDGGNDNVRHTEAMFPRLDVLGALQVMQRRPCAD